MKIELSHTASKYVHQLIADAGLPDTDESAKQIVDAIVGYCLSAPSERQSWLDVFQQQEQNKPS